MSVRVLLIVFLFLSGYFNVVPLVFSQFIEPMKVTLDEGGYAKVYDKKNISIIKTIAPPEMDKADFVVNSRDSNISTDWYLLVDGIFEKTYIIAVQNQRKSAWGIQPSIIMDKMVGDSNQADIISFEFWGDDFYGEKVPIYGDVEYIETVCNDDNSSCADITKTKQIVTGYDNVNKVRGAWLSPGLDGKVKKDDKVLRKSSNVVGLMGRGPFKTTTLYDGVRFYKLKIKVPVTLDARGGLRSKGRVALDIGGVKYHPWWDDNYLYRQQITITNNNAIDAAPTNWTTNITKDTRTANTNVSLASGNDVRIVSNTSGANVELDRINSTAWNDANTVILFKTTASISAGGTDDNYWVYYGNSGAGSPPTLLRSIFMWVSPLSNVVAMYFFEGDAVDSSPNSYDGIINGTTITNNGKFGDAYSFDGGTNRINITAITAKLSASAGTITAWTKPIADSGNRYIFNHYNAGNRIYVGQNDADYYITNLGVSGADTDGILSNVVYFLGMSWDGTRKNVYKDGTNVRNVTYTGLSTIGSEATIGNNNGGTEGFNADYIDSVIIYDRQLTDAEFSSQYISPDPTTSLGAEECLDCTPPVVTIHAPTNTTAIDLTPLLNTTFGETVNFTWYNVDGGSNSTPIGATSNLTLNLSTLAEGNHIVTVYANDSQGNLGSTTRHFTVDATAPYRVTLLAPSPPNQTLTSNGTITFNVSVRDNTGSELEAVLNVSGVQNTTWGVLNNTANSSSVPFPDGYFEWNITGRDGANNSNTSETRWFIGDFNGIYQGINNTLFSNGTTSRADHVNGTYKNISADVVLSTNESNMIFYTASVSTGLFKLYDFGSALKATVNLSGYQMNLTGNISRFELTTQGVNILIFSVDGDGRIFINRSSMTNGDYTRSFDGKSNGTVTVANNLLQDNMTLSGAHTASYTPADVITYLSKTPTADTRMEAYDPFAVETNITSTNTSLTWQIPVLVVLDSSLAEFGTYDMVYLSGKDNSIKYIRTLYLPTGTYFYYVKVLGSDSVTYYSSLRKISMVQPTKRETTEGWIIPTQLLATFIGPTPVSHAYVSTDFKVAGKIWGPASGINSAVLQVVDNDGAEITTYTMTNTLASDGTYTAFATVTLPSGYNIIWIRMYVTDGDSNTVYSVSRMVNIVKPSTDQPIKEGLDIIQQSIPAERGSPEKKYGQYLVGIFYILFLVAMAMKSAGGVLIGTPLGSIGIILLVQGGYFPLWMSVIVIIGAAALAAYTIMKLFREH